MNHKRWEQILEILEESQYISNNKLSSKLGVSTNTIRNDIKALDRQGRVRRTHGGVAYRPSSLLNTEIPFGRYDMFEYRKRANVDKKEVIAKLVVEKIPKTHNISLFMDGSTTCIQIAEALVNHPYKLVIVTNFPEILNILCNSANITLFFLGGVFWKEEHYTIGNTVCDAIKSYTVDIAIMGITALNFESPKQGAYDSNMDIIAIKESMIMNASKKWLVCDSTKFNKTNICFLCSIDNFDNVFMDTKPPKYHQLASQYKNIFIYPQD